MKEFKVTITESLKMNVFVEAESEEEAKQLVSDRWHKGEYILDAENFANVEFDANEVSVELSYSKMEKLFTRINIENKSHIYGYIIFDQSSFTSVYSEQSRTYRVSSDNKAFKPNAGEYSIFGSCLDGTDQNLRIEEYMRGKNAWKIQKCYLRKSDYCKYKELIGE